jgi:hypothetical protein
MIRDAPGEGGGGQQFVTKPCKNIGICRVFSYEGEGDKKKLENCVTFPKLSIFFNI